MRFFLWLDQKLIGIAQSWANTITLWTRMSSYTVASLCGWIHLTATLARIDAFMQSAALSLVEGLIGGLTIATTRLAISFGKSPESALRPGFLHSFFPFAPLRFMALTHVIVWSIFLMMLILGEPGLGILFEQAIINMSMWVYGLAGFCLFGACSPKKAEYPEEASQRM